jgi:biotin synthase
MKSATVKAARPPSSARRTGVLKALENQQYGRETLRQALFLEGEEQAQLFALARAQRQRCFPLNEVEVRSVIEISNVCTQQCEYCGMGQTDSPKYLLSHDEFVEATAHLYASGRRVLLLQSGENRSQAFVEHVCGCLQAARSRFADLQFILCLGNFSKAQYSQMKAAGADRYILKFETSNPRLYERLKPNDTFQERIACLENLLAVGFKVGSGNIVGLPGQSIDEVLDDLLFVGKFPLAMVSCSAFIPGEGSKLHDALSGSPDMTLNLLALMRILYPDRLIPTTSPLERLKKDGQYFGLMAGANTVTIHDGTPKQFKQLFPIYSGRRFTPNVEHIHNIVKRAGLRLAKGPLI